MPTLIDQYRAMTAKRTFATQSPFIIRLLENPASPIPFPGQIDLKEHDYMHCILGQPITLDGEAYTIGFTMGCDDRLTPFHLFLFKKIADWFYPKKYAFSKTHWQIFDQAVKDGKQSRLRNLHKVDFTPFEQQDIATIKGLFAPVAYAR